MICIFNKRMFVVQQFKDNIMKIKGFVATLYYWALILTVFVLFNGFRFMAWEGYTQAICGIAMVIALIVSHVIYWGEDHEKEGDKKC